jgi:hypothetical protein
MFRLTVVTVVKNDRLRLLSDKAGLPGLWDSLSPCGGKVLVLTGIALLDGNFREVSVTLRERLGCEGFGYLGRLIVDNVLNEVRWLWRLTLHPAVHVLIARVEVLRILNSLLSSLVTPTSSNASS